MNRYVFIILGILICILSCTQEENKPENIQNQVARLSAGAAQKLLQLNQADAAHQRLEDGETFDVISGEIAEQYDFPVWKDIEFEKLNTR